MAKRPETPAQQDERDRMDDMAEENTFGRGADDVRSIADEEDVDEFDETDEDEDEGTR
jgi:hypothetical protein